MDEQDFDIIVSNSDPADFDKFYRRNNFNILPERALLLAVLEDALNSLEHKKYRQAAIAWIFKEYDRDWLFSFGSICAELEINEDYFKRGIKKWIKTHKLKK